ncbi:oligopeptide-binding protein OppA precursor [Clostridium acetireducens DSM 10703]|uniref:Oligopeptide-binding protein OppA n=1 Tax=Clostridium acetireducens DSM 10703 TaxID=1121290 RepID=A0A1E8EYS9_9CLOT|nr:peptide ABC transporter substrate-binding protein [Clostridium acetireducens]OFI06127.1 oligopeptide-binding protein OppA precursor [Clostridium acetireducens DSM 10703]
MKSKKILSLLITFSLLATTALFGCGGSDNKEGTSKGNIDKDQYLNVVLRQEPKSLDPSKASDLYSSQVIAEIYEGLTRIEQDENGKDVVKAAGAEKWDISEDGLTWTFHLKDYNWSDGEKVKAKDFEYGIKRTLDPKVASTYSYLLYPIKGAEAYNKNQGSADNVAVKAIDDKTLEIKLEKPCAYFLNLTYFKVMMPQRQDIVEKYEGKFGTEPNYMLFCGPFNIKEWTHGNKIELVKNDKYWDAKSVKLDKVTMKIVTDEQARMNELLNGSLDLALVTKTEWVDKFDKTGKFDTIKSFEPTTNYIFFNQKEKVFSNAKVRKAFSVALDREDIAKTVYRGLDAPAYAWCPPTLLIGNDEFRNKVNSEPAKKLKQENPDAKKLLIEGLKELGMDEDPSKLSITFSVGGTDARDREVAEYYQQVYKKVLGIDLKIDYSQWAVFLENVQSLKYQMGMMAWSGDYNDPMTEFDLWITGSGMIPTGWSNPKYDELINKAASLPKEKNDERAKLFAEAEKILIYDDATVAPTTYRKKSMYKHKYVKGLMVPLFGSEMDLKYAYTEGRK